MSIYSGRYGNINGQRQVMQWSVDCNMTDNAHANSATRGAKARDKSVNDWTGNVTTDGPFYMTDWDEFDFEGYTGALTYGGSGLKLSGKALWTSIAVTGDIPSGGRVQTSAQLGGSGALVWGMGTVTDTSEGPILLAKDCIVKWNGTAVDYQNFNFTVTHEAQPYVGSDTISGGHVWTKRYPGIIDCTGSIAVKSDTMLGANGDLHKLEITCGEIEILSLEYARYLSTTGVTANPSSGELVGYTINFGMSAHSESGTLGSMTLFDTDVWPPTA